MSLGRSLRERVYESYRAAIPFIADWDVLAYIAEKVLYDRRLKAEERDTLLADISLQETVVRPNRPNLVPS